MLLLCSPIESFFFFLNWQFKMTQWDASVDRSLVLALLPFAQQKQIHTSTMDMAAIAELADKGSLWMVWTGMWSVAM